MAITFERRTLDNGLTIVAEVDPDAHSSAAGFFVRTGARDEPADLMGVSHFLEHMMFKGTEDLSTEDINRGFDAMGARNNAFTSHEMTVFYAQVLPDRLGDAVSLLGRMMRPALRETDFESERQVILEEIAMYADMPRWVLYESLGEHHYSGHPLGFRVLGTPDTIRAMHRDAMRTYFDHRYASDSTTLALAGRVDFSAVCAQAEDLCGSWTRGGATRDSSRPATSTGGFALKDDSRAGVHDGGAMALVQRAAIDTRRRSRADTGGGDNSRLYWGADRAGIAGEAQAGYEAHDGIEVTRRYVSAIPGRADARIQRGRAGDGGSRYR
ncbi:MAG: insulinase family protein [Phycisphaeraceae bacterium]|nr:insulinase family protein [Phycisphaeraceae bacterium]